MTEGNEMQVQGPEAAGEKSLPASSGFLFAYLHPAICVLTCHSKGRFLPAPQLFKLYHNFTRNPLVWMT